MTPAAAVSTLYGVQESLQRQVGFRWVGEGRIPVQEGTLARMGKWSTRKISVFAKRPVWDGCTE